MPTFLVPMEYLSGSKKISLGKQPQSLLVRVFILLFAGVNCAVAQAQSTAPSRPVAPRPSVNRSLDYYLVNASQNSPLIKELANQQLSAGLDSLRIRRLNGPQVSANSIADYAPSFKGFGYDLAISNGGIYNATVNVSQPILNRAYIRAQLQDILVRRDSLGNTSRINQADLKRNVINQYIQSYTDQNQFLFQQDVLKLLIEQENILKPLVRSGVFRQSDYLTFLVSRQSQEVTVAQQKILVQNDLGALNLLCGISDTTYIALADPAIVRGTPRELARNPLYLKYSLDSLRLQSLRKSLDTYYRPKLSWFVDAGFESSTLAFYRHYGTSFGLNFTLPIYDGHLRRIGYKQLSIGERTRQNYRSFFEVQYSQQILALTQQLASTEALLAKIKTQLHYSNMLIDVDRKLLNVGDLKITDYLLALNAYRTNQFALSQQDLSRMLLINQLNYWNSEY